MNVLRNHGLRQDLDYFFDHERDVIPAGLPKHLGQRVLPNVTLYVIFLFVFLLDIGGRCVTVSRNARVSAESV